MSDIQTISEQLEIFDKLPDSAFVRLPVLKALFGISQATVWRYVKKGSIPQPVKITERTTGWNVGSVRAKLQNYHA